MGKETFGGGGRVKPLARGETAEFDPKIRLIQLPGHARCLLNSTGVEILIQPVGLAVGSPKPGACHLDPEPLHGSVKLLCGV